MDTHTEAYEGLPFTKMSASGNDFILINNFTQVVSAEEGPWLAKKLCRRALSVGADGLILIEPPHGNAAFSWRFYNADGSEAEMCGNGGRCAARFAVEEGLATSPLVFETLAGPIWAEVRGKRVRIKLSPPQDLRLDIPLQLPDKEIKVSFVNTGVPHVVYFVENLPHVPVKEWGRLIRFHDAFAPRGTNVNFVEVTGPREIRVRTYERGVEDETLACGTGATAAALIAAEKGLVETPVRVITSGGEALEISFGESPEEVFLEGEARFVYRARLSREALE
ncbi:MAG: diaminopimelate epimerase [Thermodesulfobacteria bacterium]|nr:diaminopimelate epimerase [Thermodesulfobacteriota bacterium]